MHLDFCDEEAEEEDVDALQRKGKGKGKGQKGDKDREKNGKGGGAKPENKNKNVCSICKRTGHDESMCWSNPKSSVYKGADYRKKALAQLKALEAEKDGRGTEDEGEDSDADVQGLWNSLCPLCPDDSESESESDVEEEKQEREASGGSPSEEQSRATSTESRCMTNDPFF